MLQLRDDFRQYYVLGRVNCRNHLVCIELCGKLLTHRPGELPRWIGWYPLHARRASCIVENELIQIPIVKKFWKAFGTRAGKPVALYVETTDALVASDLDQGAHGSLISRSCSGRIPNSEIERHLWLAIGAFRRHVRTPEVGSVGVAIEVDSIPLQLDHGTNRAAAPVVLEEVLGLEAESATRGGRFSTESVC